VTLTLSVVRSLVMSPPMTVVGPFVVYFVPFVNFPEMLPVPVLMTAFDTWW